MRRRAKPQLGFAAKNARIATRVGLREGWGAIESPRGTGAAHTAALPLRGGCAERRDSTKKSNALSDVGEAPMAPVQFAA